MIKEIKDWFPLYSSITVGIGIWDIGSGDDEEDILLPMDSEFYENLKNNYTLKDLDITGLKKRYILILQNNEVIKCYRMESIDCTECEHLSYCNYCVTKKLLKTTE
jgi:hypothetical protein